MNYTSNKIIQKTVKDRNAKQKQSSLPIISYKNVNIINGVKETV